MEEKKIVVAIDGPAGAGKSTVARAAAERIGLPYLDTGALYRAIAWKLSKEGIPPEDGGGISKALASFRLEFSREASRPTVRMSRPRYARRRSTGSFRPTPRARRFETRSSGCSARRRKTALSPTAAIWGRWSFPTRS